MEPGNSTTPLRKGKPLNRDERIPIEGLFKAQKPPSEIASLLVPYQSNPAHRAQHFSAIVYGLDDPVERFCVILRILRGKDSGQMARRTRRKAQKKEDG